MMWKICSDIGLVYKIKENNLNLIDENSKVIQYENIKGILIDYFEKVIWY